MSTPDLSRASGWRAAHDEAMDALIVSVVDNVARHLAWALDHEYDSESSVWVAGYRHAIAEVAAVAVAARTRQARREQGRSEPAEVGDG